MAKNRILYALALMLAGVFHILYTGWFSFYLLIFLLTLPLFSLFASLSSMRRSVLETELPPTCLCAEECRYVISLRRPGFLPLSGGQVRIVFEDLAEQTHLPQTLDMTAASVFRCEVPSLHAGSFRFTPTRARALDALGLFSLPIRLPPVRQIDVLSRPCPPAELPNLSRFRYRSFHPKAGGGFSETHENREYRPGDSMRDVHWKLSAKTDALVVREAQEPNHGQIVLTLDTSGTRDMRDSVLSQLAWLSEWLLSREVRHEINWLDPSALELRRAVIDSQEALQQALTALVRLPRREDMPSLADRSYPQADWRYHIRARAQEEEA